MTKSYNGWKNRQTWNVSLWINNDESLYRAAVEFVKNNKDKRKLYSDFIRYEGLENSRTPDNIAYISTSLDYEALNNMMRELVD
jgi:hypothetical protein